MKKLLLLLACAFGSSAAFAQAAAGGDVKAGEKKVAMCIGCHGIPGYQASFPEVHKVPMISGQNAKYIVASLAAYKKGERKHPTMRGIATSLSDQDMADIATFYEQHGRVEGSKVPESLQQQPDPVVAALLAKGACVSCHGANFNKPIDAAYPKIAGQYADYLYAALKAYKTDGNPNVGRTNPIMGAQVKQFSNAELKTLANYIASLPGEVKTVRQSPFHSAPAAQ